MNDITWYADLGIEIKLNQDDKQYSYCWRMLPPAPATELIEIGPDGDGTMAYGQWGACGD